MPARRLYEMRSTFSEWLWDRGQKSHAPNGVWNYYATDVDGVDLSPKIGDYHIVEQLVEHRTGGYDDPASRHSWLAVQALARFIGSRSKLVSQLEPTTYDTQQRLWLLYEYDKSGKETPMALLDVIGNKYGWESDAVIDPISVDVRNAIGRAWFYGSGKLYLKVVCNAGGIPDDKSEAALRNLVTLARNAEEYSRKVWEHAPADALVLPPYASTQPQDEDKYLRVGPDDETVTVKLLHDDVSKLLRPCPIQGSLSEFIVTKLQGAMKISHGSAVLRIERGDIRRVERWAYNDRGRFHGGWQRNYFPVASLRPYMNTRGSLLKAAGL